ncbi:hypothetical protein EX30DRAFT_338689 [Ascodesmis nigricans]|uniref:Uncharacterized protein n=1 Tax=Ascodesmis nigricans TaxID=341454 RepID=A0A4S2N4U1_9PEZI|nr:hypothetical protein EX30DRAFT_338689 [Ascodesmis nigricans]
MRPPLSLSALLRSSCVPSFGSSILYVHSSATIPPPTQTRHFHPTNHPRKKSNSGHNSLILDPLPQHPNSFYLPPEPTHPEPKPTPPPAKPYPPSRYRDPPAPGQPVKWHTMTSYRLQRAHERNDCINFRVRADLVKIFFGHGGHRVSTIGKATNTHIIVGKKELKQNVDIDGQEWVLGAVWGAEKELAWEQLQELLREEGAVVKMTEEDMKKREEMQERKREEGLVKWRVAMEQRNRDIELGKIQGPKFRFVDLKAPGVVSLSTATGRPKE